MTTPDPSSWLPNLLPVLIKVAGTAQTARRYVNFVGVTASDDSANDQCTLTVSPATLSGLGTGVATFLATPSSANLRAALTDETGTGAAVFAGSPTLTGLLTAGGLRLGTQAVNDTGTVNDLVVNAGTTFLKFTNAGGISLGGLAVAGGNLDGMVLYLLARGGASVATLEEEAGSTAANRLTFGGARSIPYGAAIMYDGTTSRWVWCEYA